MEENLELNTTPPPPITPTNIEVVILGVVTWIRNATKEGFSLFHASIVLKENGLNYEL